MTCAILLGTEKESADAVMERPPTLFFRGEVSFDWEELGIYIFITGFIVELSTSFASLRCQRSD